MILEGQMLLAVLIVVALAITALGMYIRFGMKKASSDADIILSRFLGRSGKATPDAAVKGRPGTAAAGKQPGASMTGNPATTAASSDKKGLLSGIGGGFGGLMGRKSKDQIKEEEKLIDSQLEQVMQLTEEITKTDNGMPSLAMPDITPGNAASPGMPLSMPDNSMPSLTLPDNSMPSLTLPDNNMPSLTMPDNSMPSLTLPDNSMPSLTLPDNGLQLTLPDPEPAPAPAPAAAPAAPVYKSDGSATKKLCKEYVMPPEPMMPGEEGLKLSAGGIDFSPDAKDKDKKDKGSKVKPKISNTQEIGDFGGKKKDKKDDLLSDLEEEASKEIDVDMSIMKEYRDLTITTDELENELKGIIDQIHEKTGGKKDARA